MDYDLPPDLQQLRRELRERISRAFPDGFPTIFTDDPAPLANSHEFCQQLGSDGLMTIAWPEQYGGKDAGLWAQLVVAEEMWAHDEPRGGQYYGPNWIGPTIMRFGSQQQKDLHLAGIACGRTKWAQGYSEPEAGSDLASVRLRGEPVDGGWRLSGQKIWTSYGDYAEWIILVARTEQCPDKHDGITVFLLPMDSEGIEVRPIRNITGPHDFNEVFFDNVFACHDDVLGLPGRGWDVVRASLAFERVGNPRWARVERLLAEVRRHMVTADPSREQIASWIKAAIGCRVARLVQYRVVADQEAAAGNGVSPIGSSVFRALNTTNDQLVMDVLVDYLGPRSWLAHTDDGVVAGGELEHEWRMSRTATVAAGTLEIQKMVIARETLRGA